MKLISLQPPLQPMCWSNTFMLSLWEGMLTWLRHLTTTAVDCRSNINKHCQADHEQLHWQQSPSLLGGTKAPQGKCLVGEGMELLTTINPIGEWIMGNSEAVHHVQLTTRQCGGSPATGLCCCLFCASHNTTTVYTHWINKIELPSLWNSAWKNNHTNLCFSIGIKKSYFKTNHYCMQIMMLPATYNSCLKNSHTNSQTHL